MNHCSDPDFFPVKNSTTPSAAGTKRMGTWLKKYWLLLIPTVFFPGLVLSAGPLLLMKKVVAFLALPAGLVWIALTYLMFWPGHSRLLRGVLILTWTLYTLGGNPLIGNRLLQPLEKPYSKFTSPEEPFDIIFVLGGGTTLTLDGIPQLGSAGDRVIKAARLYHEGKARKLVASGRSITEIWGDRDLSEEAMTIWKELGIPEEAMLGFDTPRNTNEEIAVYKKYLDSLEEKPERIGIITSAWHLKRTEKHWKNAGIDAIPIPADFRSRPIPFMSTYLIPKKRGFAHVQIALWEYLGILVD